MPVTLDAAEKVPILQRPVGVRHELRLQAAEVDAAVVVLRDGRDVGDRLAPGQLVGVVLVRADEHDRPLAGGIRSRRP